jgi:hypothetical protein
MLQEQHEQTRTTCLLTGPASFNQRTHVHARRETFANTIVQRGIPEMSAIKMFPPISSRINSVSIIGQSNRTSLAHFYKNVHRHRHASSFRILYFYISTHILYRAFRLKLKIKLTDKLRDTERESFTKKQISKNRS